MKQRKEEPVEGSVTCTWAINFFPRKLKNRFLARAKIMNMTGGDYLEYVISRYLREASTKQEN